MTTDRAVTHANAAHRRHLLDELKLLHRTYAFKSDIVDVALGQTTDVCFLEITEQRFPGEFDHTTRRIDLSFIVDAEHSVFTPAASLEQNVESFFELDAYTLLHIFGLFDDREVGRIEHDPPLPEDLPFD